MFVSTKMSSRAAMFIAATLVAAVGLSACNTVEGAGKDIKSTGKAIERTADDNK